VACTKYYESGSGKGNKGSGPASGMYLSRSEKTVLKDRATAAEQNFFIEFLTKAGNLCRGRGGSNLNGMQHIRT
jgi:hypothetical protein